MGCAFQTARQQQQQQTQQLQKHNTNNTSLCDNANDNNNNNFDRQIDDNIVNKKDNENNDNNSTASATCSQYKNNNRKQLKLKQQKQQQQLQFKVRNISKENNKNLLQQEQQKVRANIKPSEKTKAQSSYQKKSGHCRNSNSSKSYNNNNKNNIVSFNDDNNNNNNICSKQQRIQEQQQQHITAAAAIATTTITTTIPTATVQPTTTTTQQYEQQQYARICKSIATPTICQLDPVATHTCQHRGSGNFQTLLLHARTALTTQMTNVGNRVYENLNFYYMATETTAALRQHNKRNNNNNTYNYNKSKQPQQQQQQQQQYRQRVTACKMHCHQQNKQLQQQQQQRNAHTGSHIDIDNNNNNTKSINNNTNTNTNTNTNNNKRNMNRNTALRYGCAVAASASAASTAAYNYIGHNYYHLLRNSISLYAASSVILVLCYLTTSTSATPNSEAATIDKHPIVNIDWSKFDESSSDKEILDLLLEKKRYDKRLLPPVNDEDFCCGLSSPDMAKQQNSRRTHNRGTLTVNVNVLLLSLASPDESSLKYEVEFLLNQQWADPRLQYGNKSHYDFLNALHHHDSIWTPDTYFIMHGDFKEPLIPMHFALRIYRNGTITYAMRRHLILSCQGSLHIFPFDDPKCSFSIESISYEEAQIKYVWKNDEDTLRKSPSLTTLNAYLIKNQTTSCDQNSWRGNYSCLMVELTFTRDRAYYFTTVFIPGIILVTSSFITFWLEWNAVPARVMIGVTTMLNFFTTSNGFRSTLPVVSNLTAMNVWDGVCMCFIYASLLEFVCVNYVGRKRPLHNVVYRPGENPVTQAAAGMSSAAPSSTPLMQPPAVSSTTRIRWEEQHGGIIGAAVQNLRARSAMRRQATEQDELAQTQITTVEHTYTEPVTLQLPLPLPSQTPMPAMSVQVSVEEVPEETEIETERDGAHLRRCRSMSTNTPPLIMRGALASPQTSSDLEQTERQLPLRPPRKKVSRSNSPVGAPTGDANGEKRRDASAPNEIVACTTCAGSSSPCTHSANNGCATETCFVQVRKKEPPHPIRVAKTIDVIARITFPTAYAIFLIFFFVHYKGFS